MIAVLNENERKHTIATSVAAGVRCRLSRCRRMVACSICLILLSGGANAGNSVEELLGEAEEQMWLVGGILMLVLPPTLFEERQRERQLTEEEVQAALAKAAALLEQALEIDPNLDTAHQYLVAVHFRAKDFAKAEEYARAYWHRRPDETLGPYFLFLVYYVEKDWDALIELHDEALKTKGFQFNELCLAQGAALAWLHKGDLVKARQYADRAREVGPDDPGVLYIVGAIQKASGDQAGYVATVESLKDRDPDVEKRIQSILDYALSDNDDEDAQPDDQQPPESTWHAH